MSDFDEIKESWAKIWEETQFEPDMMCMAWDTACELARLHGMKLPNHLIPGEPVILNSSGFHTYIEDENGNDET